jgi:surfeit locus 1 family protein
MSVANLKKKFIQRLEFIILFLVMIILLNLGFWQLHRAEEKKMLLRSVRIQGKADAIKWSIDNNKPDNFQKIKVFGTQLTEVFYLDNKFYKHQPGYNIITPVILKNKQVLLIDQGWIPRGEDRKSLPVLKKEYSNLWIGQVYYPQVSKIDLGQFLDYKTGRYFVIETLNLKEIEKILGRKVLPWVLRNTANHDSFYIRQWEVVAVSPERHLAYATQWFAMALIVLMILIWRLYKK